MIYKNASSLKQTTMISIKVTKLPIEGIKSTQIHAVSLNLNYWSKQIFMLLVNVKAIGEQSPRTMKTGHRIRRIRRKKVIKKRIVYLGIKIP